MVYMFIFHLRNILFFTMTTIEGAAPRCWKAAAQLAMAVSLPGWRVFRCGSGCGRQFQRRPREVRVVDDGELKHLNP